MVLSLVRLNGFSLPQSASGAGTDGRFVRFFVPRFCLMQRTMILPERLVISWVIAHQPRRSFDATLAAGREESSDPKMGGMTFDLRPAAASAMMRRIRWRFTHASTPCFGNPLIQQPLYASCLAHDPSLKATKLLLRLARAGGAPMPKKSVGALSMPAANRSVNGILFVVEG